MSFQVRPYQRAAIDAIRGLMRNGVKAILHTAPTGSGKTAEAAYMVGTSAGRRHPCWFVVHRRELVKQTMQTFDDVGIRYGVCAAGFDEDPLNPVQICSIQTLARRFHRIVKPDLIVWDEAHHVAAASWRAVYAGYPQAYHVGLTATPQRLDGKGLGEWFDDMVLGPSVAWLIARGYLSKYRIFCPSQVDLTGVQSRMGDFVRGQLAQAVSKAAITGDVIKHYRKIADGKRAVVFCVSIQHSQEVVKTFNEIGVPAEHVDGETPAVIRDGAMKRFRDGKTLILSNCDLFGEGVDVPAMEAAILLRPTQSLGLYLQQVGRALRPHPGKEHAIILDHVGNAERHGLPDEDRVWSLADKARKKRDLEVRHPVRICPSCFAAQKPGPRCEFCGHVFEVKPRKIDVQDGDLVEVDPAAVQRDNWRRQSDCKTFLDLVAEGKRRKLKNPYYWAKHVWNGRQRKKLREGRLKRREG